MARTATDIIMSQAGRFSLIAQSPSGDETEAGEVVEAPASAVRMVDGVLWLTHDGKEYRIDPDSIGDEVMVAVREETPSIWWCLHEDCLRETVPFGSKAALAEHMRAAHSEGREG